MAGEGIPTSGESHEEENGDDPGSPITGDLLPDALAAGTDTLEALPVEPPPEDPQAPTSN